MHFSLSERSCFCNRFAHVVVVARKFIQSHIPLLRFNSPSLETKLSNVDKRTQAKVVVEPVLKIEKSALMAKFANVFAVSIRILIIFCAHGHILICSCAIVEPLSPACFPCSGDGKAVELAVKNVHADEILKMIQQADGQL